MTKSVYNDFEGYISTCPCLKKSKSVIIERDPKLLYTLCFHNDTNTQTFLSSRPFYFDGASFSLDFRLQYKILSAGVAFASNNCTVVIKLVDTLDTSQKYVCPEACKPYPTVEIPLKLLTANESILLKLNTSLVLTCSFTMLNIIDQMKKIVAKQPAVQEILFSYTKEWILKEITVRRLLECNEHQLWPRFIEGVSSSLSKDSFKVITPDVVRRNIFGLVLWVGSNSRSKLLHNQVNVISSYYLNGAAETKHGADLILGWLATEDIYDCLNSTLDCHPEKNQYLLPVSFLSSRTLGWRCAQRRPLQALAHVLLLFDPQFILMVDDDTYVNMDILTNPKMKSYISHELTNMITVGMLGMELKLSSHGFYLGGAGYLLGHRVLTKLVSTEITGPMSQFDEFGVERQSLGLLKQAVEIIKSNTSTCPQNCININSINGKYYDWGSSAKLAVRVIDLSVNLMSDSYTCYHSDHALTRMLLYGVYANTLSVNCDGTSKIVKDLTFGMCFEPDFCDVEIHLTCHRHRAIEPKGEKIIPTAMKKPKTIY